MRFTEGSLFELSHPPNQQKDHLSAGNSTEVPIMGNVTLRVQTLDSEDDVIDEQIAWPARPSQSAPRPKFNVRALRL